MRPCHRATVPPSMVACRKTSGSCRPARGLLALPFPASSSLCSSPDAAPPRPSRPASPRRRPPPGVDPVLRSRRWRNTLPMVNTASFRLPRAARCARTLRDARAAPQIGSRASGARAIPGASRRGHWHDAGPARRRARDLRGKRSRRPRDARGGSPARPIPWPPSSFSLTPGRSSRCSTPRIGRANDVESASIGSIGRTWYHRSRGHRGRVPPGLLVEGTIGAHAGPCHRQAARRIARDDQSPAHRGAGRSCESEGSPKPIPWRSGPLGSPGPAPVDGMNRRRAVAGRQVRSK